MNHLDVLNAEREDHILHLRDRVIAAHGRGTHPPFSTYPLEDFRNRATASLKERFGRLDLEVQLKVIERERFGGDLAILVPVLLKEEGNKKYMSDYVPWINEVLSHQQFSRQIRRIEARGIYINILLSDGFLIRSLSAILDPARDFGHNDVELSRTYVIDYSSPNVAKVLHAGHIRSTIIGHVLGNLHTACGARVFRVNHINDFGGFGYMLEGYRRWRDMFSPNLTPNEVLLRVYALRRTLEKAASGAELTLEDRALLEGHLGAVGSRTQLAAEYDSFRSAADAAFARLEAGVVEEIELWRKMVEWSLNEFERFYQALCIHIDFTIGESFYYKQGNAVVDQALHESKAVRLSEALACEIKQTLQARLARDEITQEIYAKEVEAVEKDIGAIVVPLPDGERLVVRRSDGRSIYATRDLGAIQVRRRIFNPTDITYVVGQEQKVHFERLFQAASVLGLLENNATHLEHVYFGFYVDARTKRRLSSREGSSNVHHLLTRSVEHFRRKYEDDATRTEEAARSTAQQLAVGSLIFNDLRKDMKSAVEIPTDNMDVLINSFENAGGAYVVYAACRARSILRKYSGELPAPEAIAEVELTPREALLILQLQQLPAKLVEAATRQNPSVLIDHLLEVAASYNSYYTQSPVLKRGAVFLHRLLITAAVQYALEGGLRICHIECPERI